MALQTLSIRYSVANAADTVRSEQVQTLQLETSSTFSQTQIESAIACAIGYKLMLAGQYTKIRFVAVIPVVVSAGFFTRTYLPKPSIGAQVAVALETV
jgi:hypothetical protein